MQKMSGRGYDAVAVAITIDMENEKILALKDIVEDKDALYKEYSLGIDPLGSIIREGFCVR